MRQDDLDESGSERGYIWAGSRTFAPAFVPPTQEWLTLQDLLASDVTGAVLRADGLEMRSFIATLQLAAERLRARQARAQPIPEALRLGLRNLQD